MNKSIMNLEDVEVLSKNKQRNVIKVGNDVGRSKKGRQWRIKLFDYTLLKHNNDACNNSDGNWDWGGNGTVPTTN